MVFKVSADISNLSLAFVISIHKLIWNCSKGIFLVFAVFAKCFFQNSVIHIFYFLVTFQINVLGCDAGTVADSSQ